MAKKSDKKHDGKDKKPETSKPGDKPGDKPGGNKETTSNFMRFVKMMSIPAMIFGNGMQVLMVYVLFYADLGTVSTPESPVLPLAPVTARTATYVQDTVFFPAKDGQLLEAFLFTPRAEEAAGAGRPPLVIMAHGMGAQKDMVLPEYAKEFAKAGMASLVFDYRTFGGSYGEPRHQVAPWDHIDDYLSAIEYAQGADMAKHADGSRIALWGTSFAGGHVLVAAATSPLADRIKAVVSQVPYLDPEASASRVPLMTKMRFASLATRDLVARYLGRDRTYVRLYPDEPDDVAILSAGGPITGWEKLKQGRTHRGNWENRAAASLLFDITMYSPRSYAKDVKAPVQMLAAIQDELCPIDMVRDTFKTFEHPESALVEVDVNHFGFYVDESFDTSVAAEVKFLSKQLGVAA